MKLKEWTRVILIGSSILALTGCVTHKRHNNGAIDDANAAYASASPTSTDVQTSGLGDETNVKGQDEKTDVADDEPVEQSAAPAPLQHINTNNKNLASERTYYFDYDSYKVRDQYLSAIDANAGYLIAHPTVKILLEGHTDPRGSREYNIGLGERRARAVADLLTSKGVNRSQIRIVSYGAEKLAANGRSEEDYQLDRRGIIVHLRS